MTVTPPTGQPSPLPTKPIAKEMTNGQLGELMAKFSVRFGRDMPGVMEMIGEAGKRLTQLSVNGDAVNEITHKMSWLFTNQDASAEEQIKAGEILAQFVSTESREKRMEAALREARAELSEVYAELEEVAIQNMRDMAEPSIRINHRMHSVKNALKTAEAALRPGE